jgi:ADP-ribosyl-[dinitrogen reductase] hydrolase
VANDLSQDSYRGALLGLATGDALGAPYEFRAPGSFEPPTEMESGGAFHLKAGEWTDDTSMALCLAESLIGKQAFDPLDQMQRYVRWMHDGHLSSIGRCFDIGNTTSAALTKFQRTGRPYGDPDPRCSGNGSIMRLAPVPLFYAYDPALAIRMAGASSETTHPAIACVDACRYLAALMLCALQGASKEELTEPYFTPVSGYWQEYPLTPEIAEIAAGSFRERKPPAIRGSGWVVKSLEAALWAFYRSSDFEEGCRLAIGLGEDTDTTAAVYGQLAGTYYGESGIPARWLAKLAHREMIERFADDLVHLNPPS